MLRVLNASSEMKIKVFSGNAAMIESEVTAFLAAHKVKVHHFVQSQSTIANSLEVNITATLLYTEYVSSEESIGFNR